MKLLNIPVGKKPPEDIYAIIEIASNTNPIKYEIEKEYGVLFVDRFIPTAMFYPCNYGYINNTLSTDGDPLDVLVITPYSIQPGVVIRCRPIGLLNMTDESGRDVKLIAVPHKKICKEYDDVKDIHQLSESLKSKIVHFFEHYKDLEKEKWIKVKNWENIEAAKLEILSAISRFNNN